MIKPKIYVKMPIPITAVQWDGSSTVGKGIVGWIEDHGGTAEYLMSADPKFKDRLDIITLEGRMTASTGDYIIRGIKGEFYPCKPDIFGETYSELDGQE